MTRQVLSNEKIIQTGIDLIENDSLPTFSTIAKKLGTRSQALYSYFNNQTELNYVIVAIIINRVDDHLQNTFFGTNGINSIVAFAEELRSLTLRHIKLAQFVLSMPRKEEFPDAIEAYTRFQSMLHQLVNNTYMDQKQRILVNRCVRDLIVGNVTSISSGWFGTEIVSSNDTFSQLLLLNLEQIQKMNL